LRSKLSISVVLLSLCLLVNAFLPTTNVGATTFNTTHTDRIPFVSELIPTQGRAIQASLTVVGNLEPGQTFESYLASETFKSSLANTSKDQLSHTYSYAYGTCGTTWFFFNDNFSPDNVAIADFGAISTMGNISAVSGSWSLYYSPAPPGAFVKKYPFAINAPSPRISGTTYTDSTYLTSPTDFPSWTTYDGVLTIDVLTGTTICHGLFPRDTKYLH
jgi:hypothetical protein